MNSNDLIDKTVSNSRRILLLEQENFFLKEVLRRCERCAKGDRYSLVQEEIERHISYGQLRLEQLDQGTPLGLRINSIKLIIKDALDG